MITLPQAYLDQLSKVGKNHPNVILEAEFEITRFLADGSHIADGSITAVGSVSAGPTKWGQHHGGFNDVLPIVKSVTSVQNKIDPKKGVTTRGSVTFTISGKDYINRIIQNVFFLNKKVTMKEGFVADGYAFADYAEIFVGRITDWKRNGDEMTFTVTDDVGAEGDKQLPIKNNKDTQFIDYRNFNPVDIMIDLQTVQADVLVARLDIAKYESERDTWLPGVIFNRVLTKPKKLNALLDELMRETNSFIIHDGTLGSFKVFAPTVPGQVIQEFSEVELNEFKVESGYVNNFFNVIVFAYDYKETGSDNYEDYETFLIVGDVDSQADIEWDKSPEKIIKSKWLRSITWGEPTNITGVTIYQVSTANDVGDGVIVFDKNANTLTWTPPGSPVGAAIELSKSGKLELKGADINRSIKIVVDVDNLPTVNKQDIIAIAAVGSAAAFANNVATKLLNRYRDPLPIASMSISMNHVPDGNVYRKPTDIIDITTEEVAEKSTGTWVRERVMITSLRPGNNKVALEAVPTRLNVRGGFISPTRAPGFKFEDATEAEREFGFIGRNSDNKLFDGSDFVEGNVII